MINAEGEQQAAQKLLETAEILGQRPEAMQLRYLSTLNVIAGERSSTIAFPFPLDFIDMLAYRTDDAGRQGQGSRVLCQHVV